MQNEEKLILVEERVDRAKTQIESLRERRLQSSQSLEALRSALSTVLKRTALLNDVLPFTEIITERAAKIEAMKLFRVANGEKTNINLDVAIDAIELPFEAMKLVKAWNQVHLHRPKEPERYWDEASNTFQHIPVSVEESQRIYERNKVYGTEENAELYRTAKGLVNLINFENRRLNAQRTTEAHINAGMPFLAQNIKPKTGIGTSKYFVEYELIESNFVQAGEDYRAFDEF